MEVVKEMGIDRVTGQEAMLFMLMERVDRLEQRLGEKLEREAASREELATLATRLKSQEDAVELLRLEVACIGNSIPRVGRNPGLSLDILTGVSLIAAVCAIVSTVEKVRAGWWT